MSIIRDLLDYYKLPPEIRDDILSFEVANTLTDGRSETYYYTNMSGFPLNKVVDMFTKDGIRYRRTYYHYDSNIDLKRVESEYDFATKRRIEVFVHSDDNPGVIVDYSVESLDYSTVWENLPDSTGWPYYKIDGTTSWGGITDKPSPVITLQGAVTGAGAMTELGDVTIDVESDWNNITNKPSPTITLLGDATGTGAMTELGDVIIDVTVVGEGGTGPPDWDGITNKPSPVITLQGDATGTGTMTELGDVTIDVAVVESNWSGITNKPSPVITLQGDVTGTGTMIGLGNTFINTTSTKGDFIFTVTSTNKTLVNMEFCSVNVDNVTLSLPSSPIANNRVVVAVGNFTNTLVSPNGETIAGYVDDVRINVANTTIYFIFNGSTWRVQI